MVYRASCLNFSPHSGFFSLANNKGHAPLFRWDRTSAPVSQNYLKYLVLQMSFCRRPRRRHPAGRLCVCRFRVLMLFVLVCLCLRLPTQQNVQNNVWTTNIPAHTDDRECVFPASCVLGADWEHLLSVCLFRLLHYKDFWRPELWRLGSDPLKGPVRCSAMLWLQHVSSWSVDRR